MKFIVFVCCLFLFVIIVLPFTVSDTVTTQASVGNAAPVASSVAIAPGNLNGGDIALTANQTTLINITATITDNNGCTDIDAVNATLFRTNISGGSGASDNNRTHYTITSSACSVEAGSCTGDTDIAANYNCSINVTWYADPTDAGSLFAGTNWTVNVTPWDGGGAGTYSTTIYDLKTLSSFSLLDTTINFGTLALGQNTTSTNQNVSMQNTGNEGLDFSFTGYGVTSGDNLSMNCTLGNISIDFFEYNNTAFNYSEGTSLTNTSTELDFDLDRGSGSENRPENVSYYGFRIPTDGVGGSCSGTLVIVSTSDPTLD